MKKTILFDFDGVIADTFDFLCSLCGDYSPITPDEYRGMFCNNIYNETKKIFNHKNEEEFKKHHEGWFKKYSPALLELDTFSGIIEAIKDLNQDYYLSIISSSESSAIKGFLEKKKIDNMFRDILGADVSYSKEEKIQMIFDKYDVGPKDCLFITDTVGDLIEATKKEVPVIGVTWGFHNTKHFRDYDFVELVDRPIDLKDSIDRYFRSIDN